jgi:alpha-mannosidase
MDRLPLYYAFGSHMHWVDMQWLWGYYVLPDSIRDMLHFCRETGAKGNVNFDGIGYEKLASENTGALAVLRESVKTGIIEPVGCSYGQPYGLFHGGESNLRQRIYGARTVRRLLGVWPKTFWEEEFDFFPQLPQMLSGCGFEYASLFFQWTWHTPEVPKEDVPVIWWEGQDGSRLLCATRNKLNLHQWPEDMEATFADLAANPPESGHGPTPLILQWLELMPSPDWMCRSEVLLPKMRELLADERFEIQMATLGEYLSTAKSNIPKHRYTLDDVWHGMSLGKNGDHAIHQSHSSERSLLSVEALQAILGLFGRPYDNWDVYPTWELEESWRNLLTAQHHDNHECEGLCGHVAEPQYDSVDRLLLGGERGIDHLAALVENEGVVAYNPFGWERAVTINGPEGYAVAKLPPFGYKVVSHSNFQIQEQGWQIEGDLLTYSRNGFEVRVNLSGQREIAIRNKSGAERTLNLPLVKWRSGDNDWDSAAIYRKHLDDVFLMAGEEGDVGYWLSVPEHMDALDITVSFEPLDERIPNPGLNDAAKTIWRVPTAAKLITDHPYAVSETQPKGEWLRKYPESDWMTSSQWFETVTNPFFSQSFIDLVDPDGSGLLILHNGSQQWFCREGEIHNVINMIDPWDEDKIRTEARAKYRVLVHEGLSNSKRWQLGRELFGLTECTDDRAISRVSDGKAGGIPDRFSALSCDAPNVVPTAFYRETEDFSGKYLDDYAGKGMGYPFIVRLVEFDGIETEATLTVAGTVATAYKTNHLGQILEEITSTLKVKMRPYEIATVYLDIVEGRKQTRDLDAKREIWATVHRVED